MSRLIDADAFRRELDNHWPFTKEEQSKHGIADLAKSEVLIVLNQMPTIEERKKGKWIPLGVRHGWVCSNCKKEDAYAFSLNEKCDYEMQDFFCPNCGADMRESHCDDCRFYDEECVYCPVKQERREE